MTRLLPIVSIGAQTSVGRDPESTAAAFHAGIRRIALHPTLLDADYEPYVTSEASWLGDGLQRSASARMIALVRPALEQALEPACAALKRHPLKLRVLLGLPCQRPGLTHEDVAGVAASIHAMIFERGLSSVGLEVFQHDHAAVATALQAAVESLTSGSCDACLVGGTDSYLCTRTLDGLVNEKKVLREGNPWGFVPGEASAFALLTTRRASDVLGLPPLAELAGTGLGSESVTRGLPQVCTGLGMRKAISDALLPIGDAVVFDEVLVDLNGDPYRADEFAFSVLQISHRLREPGRFVATADCWGDIGAATGALQLVLGASAWPRMRPDPRWILAITSAADTARRGAFVLHRPVHA